MPGLPKQVILDKDIITLIPTPPVVIVPIPLMVKVTTDTNQLLTIKSLCVATANDFSTMIESVNYLNGPFLNGTGMLTFTWTQFSNNILRQTFPVAVNDGVVTGTWLLTPTIPAINPVGPVTDPTPTFSGKFMITTNHNLFLDYK